MTLPSLSSYELVLDLYQNTSNPDPIWTGSIKILTDLLSEDRNVPSWDWADFNEVSKIVYDEIITESLQIDTWDRG